MLTTMAPLLLYIDKWINIISDDANFFSFRIPHQAGAQVTTKYPRPSPVLDRGVVQQLPISMQALGMGSSEKAALSGWSSFAQLAA